MANEKRLIDANALLEKLDHTDANVRKDCGCGCYEQGFSRVFLNFIVHKQPTVDAVEVVHGHWEYGKWENGHWVKGNERCRCSVCHRDFAVDHLNIWHGCPQCLAKMDGERREGE